ncbi:3D domain-containing protein [Faecalibacillus faecis]|uniref:3D domain-containing protein n=1 Tax=Faecalibacillus faecis TaxID=1982628 RepID=UPI00386D1AE6
MAVDPSIIPYGSTIKINGNEYIAEDCGGAIKGNKIDVFVESQRYQKYTVEVFIKK